MILNEKQTDIKDTTNILTASNETIWIGIISKENMSQENETNA